jgi:dTDP-4-dehydrorhamnose reductase
MAGQELRRAPVKILLIGKNGQVGFELRRALAPLAEVVTVDYPDCDLTAPDSIRRLVRDTAPDAIVNAAAYTAVDRAESESATAFAINATAPGILGEEARQIGARVIHYSTDYVYDGAKSGRYIESDATGPLCVYGASKRDGDVALAASGAQHFIFRTSWVFGAHGANFVKTMLRLAAERERLNVVADQFGAPTSAALIADVTAHALAQTRYRTPTDLPSGVYHLTAAGETSWHGFAQAIIREAAARGAKLKMLPEAVRAIATSEYPLPARRPANSRLDNHRIEETFGLAMPPWQAGLEHVLDQLIGDPT